MMSAMLALVLLLTWPQRESRVFLGAHVDSLSLETSLLALVWVSLTFSLHVGE